MRYDVVILGSGESGFGTALLAAKNRYSVFVSEQSTIDNETKKLFDQLGIEYEEGGHTEKVFQTREVVKSPGIPPSANIIKELENRNIPVISDIEFGFRFTGGKIIAVTGTDGKTTTASLIYHIFKQSGYDVALSGNIGKSFCRQLYERDSRWHVVEVSSFQLRYAKRFRPHIAILLNIAKDHLDWHPSIEDYIQSKFNITKNQTINDHFVFNANDQTILKWMKKFPINAKKHPFFPNKRPMRYRDPITGRMMEIDQQAENVAHPASTMAAAITARIANIPEDQIKGAIRTFKRPPHRLEPVTEINGIVFINDSKATNVNSAWYALETVPKPIVWIAGGVDKGNDYSPLVPLVEEKVKAIICLAKDCTPIKRAFEGIVPVYHVENMEEAIKRAFDLSSEGTTVLLSPACASFDLFNNYAERGEAFRKTVIELKETVEQERER